MHKDMIPYLQKIISLEQAAYVEENTLSQLQIERNNTDTRKYEIPMPKPPEPAHIDFDEDLLIIVFLGGIVAIAAFVLSIIIMRDISGTNFLVAAIAFAFVVLMVSWNSIDSVKQMNAARKAQYQQALEQHPIDVQNEEIAYQQALAQADYLDKLIAESQRKLSNTRQLLQKAYGKGMLYGKYQNFVAVCSICEYLESGRCSELSGPNGAYNLFETEIRMNLVITQLSSVISKLDQIQANQVMLYDAISAGNQLTSQLIGQTNECIRLGQYNARQNAITAYYSQQTAQEVSFSNWLQVLQA
mgnify:CR=1 FL=1